MTRRAILAAGAVVPVFADISLRVPVYLIVDTRAKLAPELLRKFSTSIWPEAVNDFRSGGIHLQTGQGKGEVRRAPSGRPVFTGLAFGVINIVLTDVIPVEWDKGRGLSGVTTQYDGYHVCLVALPRAHGNQIPFVSVNTCEHELLHVLMQDIYENRPKGWAGDTREIRIDWYATKLWLFHDGAEIRSSAQAYLEKVRKSPGGAGVQSI